jgi:hypothetical protein
VASLLYVGVQVRQNTRTTRAVARQSLTARAGEFQLSIATSEQTLGVVSKLFQGKELSPEESICLRFALGSIFKTVEEAFLLYREGYLGEEYWGTRWAVMDLWLRYPGIFEEWKERFRTRYHPAFAEWIERQFEVDPRQRRPIADSP